MQLEEENKRLPERPPPPKGAVESTANKNSPKFPRKESKSVNSNTTKNTSTHLSNSPASKAEISEKSQATMNLHQQTGKSQLGKSVPQPPTAARKLVPQAEKSVQPQQPQTGKSVPQQPGKPVPQKRDGKPLQQQQCEKTVPQRPPVVKPVPQQQQQQSEGKLPQEHVVKHGPQQMKTGKPVPIQKAQKSLPQQQQTKPTQVIPTIQINKGTPSSLPKNIQETTNRYNNGIQKAPETVQIAYQPALHSNPVAPRPTVAPKIPKAKPQQQIQSFTKKIFNSIPRAPNSPSGSNQKK